METYNTLPKLIFKMLTCQPLFISKEYLFYKRSITKRKGTYSLIFLFIIYAKTSTINCLLKFAKSLSNAKIQIKSNRPAHPPFSRFPFLQSLCVKQQIINIRGFMIRSESTKLVSLLKKTFCFCNNFIQSISYIVFVVFAKQNFSMCIFFFL